jgi:hypothetical protein
VHRFRLTLFLGRHDQLDAEIVANSFGSRGEWMGEGRRVEKFLYRAAFTQNAPAVRRENLINERFDGVD